MSLFKTSCIVKISISIPITNKIHNKTVHKKLNHYHKSISKVVALNFQIFQVIINHQLLKHKTTNKSANNTNIIQNNINTQ